MAMTPRRLLLVHAHPDDETINNGATMARYAAEGARVTLVTCTRGEQGEVIPRTLAHLAADREDILGRHREGELADAMALLGVTDVRFLGAPERVYRDSGMAYDEDGQVIPAPDPAPDAFALADPQEVAGQLADVIREVRPHVVITYEPGGGYGHPDHVQAHRVTMLAVDQAAEETNGGPRWDVPKLYWCVWPQSFAREMLRGLVAAGERLPATEGSLPSMIVPDDEVTTRVDAAGFTAAKVAAMEAHGTQITVGDTGTWFALSNGIRQPISGVEYYRLVRGRPGPDRDGDGRERDLFDGVA
jgi:N-acetyl-1-D-myo-inositol-2-amino-2-deoxy-alpha-D-glucopyranoside deacetylase